MKVIQNKYQKQIECPFCGSVLEFTEEDNEKDFVCPCCNKHIISSDEFGDTAEDVEYLLSLANYADLERNNGKELSSDEINDMVRNCLQLFRKDVNIYGRPQSNIYYSETGNTAVELRYNDDDWDIENNLPLTNAHWIIRVSKNYEEQTFKDNISIS